MTGQEKQRLQEIEERASLATQGPWINNELDPIHIEDYWGEKQAIAEVIGREAGTCADAEFIAHSREDIPFLCQQLRASLEREQEIAELVKCGCRSCAEEATYIVRQRQIRGES